MKTIKRAIAVVLFAMVIHPALNATPSEISVPDSTKTMQGKGSCSSQALNTIPASPLSEQEMQGLVFMREEEKLAHDVYISMSGMYDIPIFSNISQSETNHMEAVLSLLQKYEIQDPVSDPKPGAFTNKVFSELHQTLVKQGNNSLVDALRAGAFIEETDIADLRLRLGETDNDDIKIVYENLLEASYRHLRAFSRNLAFRDAPYKPERLSKEEFEEITGNN